MPAGTNPPTGGVVANTISVIQNGGATYNSLTKGFTYSSTGYFLCVQHGSADNVLEWFHATTSEADDHNNPVCKMNSTTWGVVHNGTYSTNNRTFSYNGNTYALRLELISSVLYATAVEV